MRFEDIKGREHVKRAYEVACVQETPLFLWVAGLAQGADAIQMRNAMPHTMLYIERMCPCGNYGSTEEPCICTPLQIVQYMYVVWCSDGHLDLHQSLHIDVGGVSYEKLTSTRPGETLEQVEARVKAAQPFLAHHLDLDESGKSLMRTAYRQLGMGQADYDGTLTIAHSIAALSHETKSLSATHLAEALQYRLRTRTPALSTGNDDLRAIQTELRDIKNLLSQHTTKS